MVCNLAPSTKQEGNRLAQELAVPGSIAGGLRKSPGPGETGPAAGHPAAVAKVEAADLLGISRQAVHELTVSGRLVRAGRGTVTMSSLAGELDRRGLPVPTEEGLLRARVKVAETAARLGVRPTTVWELKSRGHLRLTDLGRIDAAEASAREQRQRSRTTKAPSAPTVPERARRPADLSVREVAARLNVTSGTVRRAIRDGDLAAIAVFDDAGRVDWAVRPADVTGALRRVDGIRRGHRGRPEPDGSARGATGHSQTHHGE